MKNIILLFLFLIPVFLFAQYPTQGNKSRLGYQTTGDGLIWRGVAADTAIKPRTTANAYFQLDTVNRVLRRYIATQGSWQVVGGTPDLSAYLEIADTAAMLSNYTTFGDISTALGDYLPLQGGTLTGTGGAGFLGLIAQSGTPSTPASGFKMYANGAHNLAILDRNGWITTFDISAIANRDFTYPSVGGTFALGTGTADRSARWSATNTLAAGNFTDNGTKVQALLPFQLHQWTTAGRPTGVTGYEGYNTSDNGPEWYQGSRWAKAPEFTFNTGTQGRLPFPDANGQYTESANLSWDNTNQGLTVISTATANARGIISRQANVGIQGAAMQFEKIRATSAVQNGDIVGAFTFRGYSGTQYLSDNALFGALITGTVTSSSVPTSIFFNAGASAVNYNTQLLLHSAGNVGIGNFGSIAGGAGAITAPSEKLHVIGNITARSGTIYAETGAVNSAQAMYLLQNNNGTDTRTVIYAQTGASSGASSRAIGIQGFAPAYTNSAWGGTYIAGNYLLSATNGGATASTNQYLHFALGSTQSFTTDTVEYVFHRPAASVSLSNSTRFAALANRGFQLPATTTANRPNTKVGQYWIKANTDSSHLEMKLPSGWEGIASRPYVRSLISGLPTTNIYTANGTLTGNRTLTGGGYNLTLNTKVKIGSDSSFSHDPATNVTAFKGVMVGDSATILITGYGNGNPAIIQTNPGLENGYTLKTFVTDSQFGGYTNPDGFAVGDAVANDKFGFQWGQVARYDSLSSEGWVQDNIFGANFLRSSFYFRGGGSSVRGGEFNFLTRLTASSTPSFRVYNAVVDFFSVLANGQTIVKNRITGANFFLTDPIGDSTLVDGKVRFQDYGTSSTTAAALSKTLSNYGVGFATDGTVTSREIKRDTTIFVTADTDYDFSAAVTTAQISRRYNRIIIHMTLTSGVGADKTTTLHTPDANLMQCEILIRGTDNTGSYDNEINFGTNNAISSDGTNASGYTLAQGQGLHVRVVYNGSAYKYIYY